jgi:hypothetical protein
MSAGAGNEEAEAKKAIDEVDGQHLELDEKISKDCGRRVLECPPSFERSRRISLEQVSHFNVEFDRGNTWLQ